MIYTMDNGKPRVEFVIAARLPIVLLPMMDVKYYLQPLSVF